MLSSVFSVLFAKRASRPVKHAGGRHDRIMPMANGDLNDVAITSSTRNVPPEAAHTSGAPIKVRRADFAAIKAGHSRSTSPAKARTDTVNALVSQLHSDVASMRQQLADVERLNVHLKAEEAMLQVAMGESVEAKENFAQFVQEMEGDFKLIPRRAVWSAALDRFVDAALGRNGEAPASATMSGLAEFMTKCIAEAESDVQPVSAAVVGWHPADGDHEMLKVNACRHTHTRLRAHALLEHTSPMYTHRHANARAHEHTRVQATHACAHGPY